MPKRASPARKPTLEQQRLAANHAGSEAWQHWGPYVSERQWGTVREDYSPDGTAWEYLPHDHARSRAYRWGEDGIAGISDDKQRLCLSLALWNGHDPILKERLFGLTNAQGNHGEDVKELYWYEDATPSHSYLRMLYKYPLRAFPYAELVAENARRGVTQPEYELIDTGVFDDDRYVDVEVEYAQATPDDVLMLVTVHNRGAEAAIVHILPQLWFRNTWSWKENSPKPILRADSAQTVAVSHPKLDPYFFACDAADALLFCDNDTNSRRLFAMHDAVGYFKDGINDAIVNGDASAVNPTHLGTKVAALHRLTIPAGGQQLVRVRLSKVRHKQPFSRFDAIVAERRREADQFYAELQTDLTDPDAKLVQRQALAGMIWSKQFFHFDVPTWLKGDPAQPPPPPGRDHGRNSDWPHLRNDDILSMPDKWEYPWYAAWDLAFQCIPLAMVDPTFAKGQLLLLTREWYMHPNGQLPAYEWAFGDVNPPVHAWATWRVYQMGRKQNGGVGDRAFLERVFHKLLLNFTWWVNRKDSQGHNIFQGGFLGLDNIGVFDRSAPLPTGGHISQADGTSWMAMYALNLMRIALELAVENPVYEDTATKFFEHFLHIAEAMTTMSGNGRGLWDEQDKFYYDVLNLPDGRVVPLKVRSMVGLIPMFAVETLDPELLERVPEFTKRMEWFLKNRPELSKLVSHWEQPGRGQRRLLSLLRGHRMKCLLKRMLDETEFLSDFGVRALSAYHRDHPYVFASEGMEHRVAYVPGESQTSLFGGNSNWRGPIWFPVNYLLIESLQRFHHYYGDDFTVECPTGSGVMMTLRQVADELSRRLGKIFLRGADGRRPVFGEHQKLQKDQYFRDHLIFSEYFHGDSGRGVGAEHQTGWTGLIAKLLQPRK